MWGQWNKQQTIRCCPVFELQLSDRGCVSRLLSLLGVTLNSVLVAEVNRRRRGGIMTERASIYLIQNQQACTEAAFWGSHMWACRPECMCVAVWGGQGGRSVQVWSQKAASVWTLTEFDSVFSDTRLHLEEVYWSSRPGPFFKSCSGFMWWISLLGLIVDDLTQSLDFSSCWKLNAGLNWSTSSLQYVKCGSNLSLKYSEN